MTETYTLRNIRLTATDQGWFLVSRRKIWMSQEEWENTLMTRDREDAIVEFVDEVRRGHEG